MVIPSAKTVRIVLPPVWAGVFQHAERLLRSALEEWGLDVEVAELAASRDASLNVLLGWGLFEPQIPSGARYVVHQCEPLSVDPWPERLAQRRSLLDGASEIWDYAQVNLPLHHGDHARWMPLRYQAALLRPPPIARPIWDVLFIGHLSPRRRQLLERLAHRCSVTALVRWDHELERAIAGSKVVLNVHRTDAPTPLEQPRVSHALHGQAFVLTEATADEPYAELAAADASELEEAAMHFLFDPDEREARRLAAFEAFRSGPSMADALGESLRDLELLDPQ